MRGGPVGDDAEFAGQHPVRADDEAHGLPPVIGAESTGPGEPGCDSSSASKDLVEVW